MASGDATAIPIKNQAYRVTFPMFDADGDLVTGAAALDSEISKDAGTFADCTNEATEIATSSGIYYLDLTATEMNADTVAIIVKTSTSGAKTVPIVLYPAEAADIIVNVKKVNGTDQTAGDIPALITTVDDMLDTELPAITAAVITNAAGADIAADIIALKTVADSVQTDTNDLQTQVGTAGVGLTNLGGMSTTMKGQIQTEAEDAIVAKKLDRLVLASGTVQVGGSHSTTQFDADGLPAAGDMNSFWKNCVIVFTSGSCAGVAQKITTDTYGGFTGVHTFAVIAPVAPADGNTFILVACSDEAMRGTNSAALASNYTSTRAGYLDELAAANVPADIDTLKTRVPDTISLAAIGTAVWATATRTLTAISDSAGITTLLSRIPDTISLTAIAAAVWNALTSGMSTVGSIGKKLADWVIGTSQTADVATLITTVGTPAGASVSADVAAIKAETASIQADTNSIETKIDTIDTNVDSILVDTGTTLDAAIADLPTNAELATALGTADDATLAAIAAAVVKIDAILDDTGTSGVALTAAERNAVADALLKRDWTAITGEAARSVLNALRVLRNKVAIVATTMTVYKEDDTAAAFTAAITTDASADPITASDPT